MFTLNQLRIFWVLAHSPSLTQAAKQLGVSQPSLSQQLAKLERALGIRLFDRVNNQMLITDAGRFLLGKAEAMLAGADEIETGLAAYREGRRGRIAIGALASLARNLLPEAWRRARARIPDLEIDVHELPPRDAIAQLYGRTVQVALLAAGSLTREHLSFTRIPLLHESYALATPAGLRLEEVADPERDPDPERRRILARTIRFNFGSRHNQRIDAWYRRHLPRSEGVGRCRTYEVALAMVEAGLGVALVPLLSTQLDGRLLFAVDLYAVPDLDRRILALVPSHYRRLEPLATFLAALGEAAAALVPVAPAPPPPFLAAATPGGGEGDSRSLRL